MQTSTRTAETPGNEALVHGEETASRRPRPTNLLVIVGIAGHVLSIATAWLLPLASEYRLLGDNISELAIGRYGYIQTAAFLAAGVGTLALAVVIRRVLSGSWGARAGSVLVGLYGVGPILAAIFPTDRIDAAADLQSLTTVGTIHIASALVAFLGVVTGMFVLTRTFKRNPRWRTFWPASLALAFAALSMLFLQGEGPLVGLFQRLFTGTATLWLMLIAFRLRSGATSTTSGHAVREAQS